MNSLSIFKNPLRFKLRTQLVIVMLCMPVLFAGSFTYLQQVAEEKVFGQTKRP